MKKLCSIWIIVWVIIATLAWLLGYSKALGGIALAAVISFLFINKSLSDNWLGTVAEVKKEKIHYTDDGSGYDKIIEYAYIKLQNGKIKKIVNMGYKVGDKLEKHRGEANIQVLT